MRIYVGFRKYLGLDLESNKVDQGLSQTMIEVWFFHVCSFLAIVVLYVKKIGSSTPQVLVEIHSTVVLNQTLCQLLEGFS